MSRLCLCAVVAACTLTGCGGSDPHAVANGPSAVGPASYAGARPLAATTVKAARPACRTYRRDLSAAEVSLGTVEQFIGSFGPTREARGALASRLRRLGISGSDGRLVRRLANQLRANDALLAEAERTPRDADLDTALRAIAPFNRAARRESRFAKRLGLAGCP